MLKLTCIITCAALDLVESYSCVKLQDSECVSENYHWEFNVTALILYIPATMLLPWKADYVPD